MSIRDKFAYVTTKAQDQTLIGIKEGKFAGVVYKYGKVSFAVVLIISFKKSLIISPIGSYYTNLLMHCQVMVDILFCLLQTLVQYHLV